MPPRMHRSHFTACIYSRRLDERQLERVAIKPRSVICHLGVNRQLNIARGGLNERRRGSDDDLLLQGTGSEHRVHGEIAAGLHDNILLDMPAKAAGFDRHGISTRLDKVEHVDAGIVSRFSGDDTVLTFKSVTLAPGSIDPVGP